MSLVTIPYRYQSRRGLAATLASVNEVPLQGEWIFEIDTGNVKIGDGVTHYNSLPYLPIFLAQNKIAGRKSSGSGPYEACSLSEILDFIGSATSGDILYRGSSAWARLPKSSDGNVLTLASGLPSWATSGAGGGVQFVAEATVTGSAATSVSLSGLDLTTDQYYILQIVGKNASGSTSNVNLYYNSDTTEANYKRAFSSTTATGSDSTPRIIAAAASEQFNSTVFLSMSMDGRPTATVLTYRNTSGGTVAGQFQLTYWTSTGNLTGLTLQGSVASSLDVGTKLTLYKRAH